MYVCMCVGVCVGAGVFTCLLVILIPLKVLDSTY